MNKTNDGIYLYHYNNSLNDIHNNNNDDIIKLKNRIIDLENILNIEREEYKEYYKKTRYYNDVNSMKKIENYDNINKKLSEYIEIATTLRIENNILNKKIKILEDENKNIKKEKYIYNDDEIHIKLDKFEKNIEKVENFIDKLKI
jgi:hypothetical protein